MAYKKLEITPARYSASVPKKTSQIYKGFSTLSETTNVRLFDFELIKQDMMNHFNTRKGERVMNPTYGSIIWDLIYEPLTPDVQQMVSDDIKQICNSDPRVVPIEIIVNEEQSGLLVEVTLQYVGSNQTSKLQAKFNKTTSQL